MKLSVLLPTRNGAAYLPACVQSVLDQSDDRFELVVSDNANDDGTAEVLAEVENDPRVRIVRSDAVLAVSDNWNRAFDAATGDYFLMIGDDDLLLPGAVSSVLDMLEEHDRPECVTFNAYSFVFPAAMEGIDTSHWAPRHFAFDAALQSGELVPASTRHEIVRDMFRFRPRLPLNMQTTVFSRDAARLVGEPVFRPPFPDHFALNAMLLRARRWLFADVRVLIIGLSPKSFGHFIYSSKADEGLEYLDIETKFDGWLPGNELLSAMYQWLDNLAMAYPADLQGVRVSRGDYVARQVWWLVRGWRDGSIPRQHLGRALRTVAPSDWLSAARVAADRHLLAAAWRRLRAPKGDAAAAWEGLRPLPDVQRIEELAGRVGPAERLGS